jgi:hypothetical protein
MLFATTAALVACGSDTEGTGGGGTGSGNTGGGATTTTITATTTTMTSGSGGAGGGEVCGSPADCPPPTSDCEAATCDAGQCGTVELVLGSPCAQGVCDGAGTCVECLTDQGCAADERCDTAAHVCVPLSCIDGIKNANESDVDCGGPDCAQCAEGQVCNVLEDCASGFCDAGLCAPCATNDDCDASSYCDATSVCSPRLADGEDCDEDSDCSSDSCADGVCCDTACAGLCEACNVVGSVGACTAIPHGLDPSSECAGGACDGTGACALDAGGSCSSPAECLGVSCVDGVCCDSMCVGLCQSCNVAGSLGTCTAVPVGTDPANECVGQTTCDGAGTCTTLSNGTACTLSAECASGSCVDGVCCNVACGGTCEACNVAGSVGTCSPIAQGADPANECVSGACNGALACALDDGQACATASQCLGGNCVDGVCCNSACGGTCQACNVAGNVGVCAPIPAATDPASECPGVTICNGAGACTLLGSGAACTLSGECASGSCVDGVCCNVACGGTCEACNVAGSVGTCSPIAQGADPANECVSGACNGALACALDDGQACATASQCLGGNCVDGVCCNSACGGTCQACNVAGNVGVCAPIPAATDPASECPGITTCNGSGACALLGSGAACTLSGECASGSCTNGVCVTACHAIRLDAATARISAPNTGWGLGAGDWTLELWMKAHDAFSGGTVTVLNENYLVNDLRLGYNSASGTLSATTYGGACPCGKGTGNMNLASGPVNDGQWHHVAVVRSGGAGRLFLDGAQVDSDIITTSLVASSPIAVGVPAGYPGYGASPVLIGPYRFSSVARYTGPFTPATHWPLDASTVTQYLTDAAFAGTLVDEAGGDNTSTYVTGVVPSSDTPCN